MESFADGLEVKLRCIARRLSSIQHKLDGDTGDAAAGTKKARCLSCDRIVRSQRVEYVFAISSTSAASSDLHVMLVLS